MEKAQISKKQKRSNNMAVGGIILLLVAAVLFIVFFISGKESTSGEFSRKESAISSTCKSATIDYPFFKTNAADKKEMDIKVISNDDKVDTISLTYRLYYGDEESIRESRDTNHFEVNKAFEKDGMEADSLGASYAKMQDNFKFNLFVKSGGLNDVTKKYLLLGDMDSDKDGKFAYDEVVGTYKAQGFNCVSNDN